MPAGEDGGWNYIEACTDTNNAPSRRVMEKAGLTLCPADEDGPPRRVVPGLGDIVAYRIARPGYGLRGLRVVELESGEATTKEEIVPRPE